MKKHTVVFLIIINLIWAGESWSSIFSYEEISIHGFVSQGYLQSGPNNNYIERSSDGTFEFNEMGINFMSELTDDLRLGIQFFQEIMGILAMAM